MPIKSENVLAKAKWSTPVLTRLGLITDVAGPDGVGAQNTPMRS